MSVMRGLCSDKLTKLLTARYKTPGQGYNLFSLLYARAKAAKNRVWFLSFGSDCQSLF